MLGSHTPAAMIQRAKISHSVMFSMMEPKTKEPSSSSSVEIRPTHTSWHSFASGRR